MFIVFCDFCYFCAFFEFRVFFVLVKGFLFSVKCFLFQESVFFPLMILSILFKQKYPILFVALNFADIALIVFLS